MTDWLPLFRALASHVTGYGLRADYRIISALDDDQLAALAKRQHMAPMPEGHPIGITDAVITYREDVR